MFCIRRKVDALYSTGGASPRFVVLDEGREWAEKGHVKRHLRLATYPKKKSGYEVVEFDDRGYEVLAYPLDTFFQPATAIVHYGDGTPVCGTAQWGTVVKRKAKVSCQNCQKTVAFQGKR